MIWQVSARKGGLALKKEESVGIQVVRVEMGVALRVGCQKTEGLREKSATIYPPPLKGGVVWHSCEP